MAKAPLNTGKKAGRIAKDKAEASKEHSIRIGRENECRRDLFGHLSQILTDVEYKILMKDSSKVDCKYLWDNNWRINFWAKTDTTNVMLTQCIKCSFFLEYDPEFGVGNVSPSFKEVIANDFKVKELSL